MMKQILKRYTPVLLLVLSSHVVNGGLCGWRHDGSGKFPDATPPVEWSEDSGIVWKASMPSSSNASPVLAGDRIFTCSEPDILVCVDRHTGDILWQHGNATLDILDDTTRAAYEREVEEGAQRHEALEQKRKALSRMEREAKGEDRELGDEYQALKGEVDELAAKLDEYTTYLRFSKPSTNGVTGYSSPTPVTDGIHVFALFGTGVAVCYDMVGNTVWRRFVEKPKHIHGFSSSPILVDGKVLVHFYNLVALDAEDGSEAWRTSASGGWGTSLQAAIDSETVVVTTGGDVVRVSDGEVLTKKIAEVTYCSPVLEGDVAYFIQEGGSAVSLSSPSGEVFRKLWTTKPRKDRYYASPVVHDGLIYALTRNNSFNVLDAVTGKVVYARILPLGSGDAYPSVTLAGDHLYLSNSNGTTLVLRPGSEYNEVAKNKLEKFRCSPLFDVDRMYVRSMKHLYCIGRE